jgi:O-antigen/teichoic acid export membrane protein
MKSGNFILTSVPSSLVALRKRIANSPIGGRLARGAFWSAAGMAASQGLTLVAWIVVTRMLGKDTFGELGIVRSTVTTAGTLALFGSAVTATKHVAEFRTIDPHRAGRIIALSGSFTLLTGSLMALGLLLFAPWLAGTLNAPHLSIHLRIGSLILLFSAINGAQTGALAGFEAFKTIAYVNLLVSVISFPIIILGVFVAGLAGAVWALVIKLAITWLICHFALRDEMRRNCVPFTAKGCLQEWPVLWKFSLPTTVGRLLIGPATWVCAALIVNQPNGFGEVGVYNAADQWLLILTSIALLASSAVTPILAQHIGEAKHREAMNVLLLAIKMNAWLVLPLALAGSLVSPWIMAFYGEGFAEAWPTLVAVLVTAAIIAIESPVRNMIVATGQMWPDCFMNMVCALVFVGGTLLLLQYGAFGLATARLMGHLVRAVGLVLFVKWYARTQWSVDGAVA